MTFLTTPAKYPYSPGDIFLGRGEFGDVGLDLERHAITVAGSRSGKGACAIIPNLLRWPQSTLVIDPKGENAAETWQARLDLGNTVRIIDPFRTVNIPDELRAAFNPLATVNPASLTAREDVEVIADGLVKRADPKHAQWDDGAAAILAGLIAFVIDQAPENKRTLTSVRGILLQSRDDLYEDAQRMLSCESCGYLAKAAGISIMTAIESEKSMEKDFLDAARRHSKWIDSPAISSVLDNSTFNLSELKHSYTSVYIVLPPEYLDTHASFMRLFVRCAINAMAAGGSGVGSKCLFILDEFFALGRIDEIVKSCGLMPSYGVHLWPFLQDLGQLKNVYHDNLWETFFSNSDIAMFFGNVDTNTTDYVSKRIGNISPQELNISPPQMTIVRPSQFDDRALFANSDYAEKMNDYNQRTKEIGRPRIPSEMVASIVGKKDGDIVASSMIVFAKAGDILHLSLAPYFNPKRTVVLPTIVKEQPPLQSRNLLKTFDDDKAERIRFIEELNRRQEKRRKLIIWSIIIVISTYIIYLIW